MGRIIKIDQKNPDKEGLEQALYCLKSGGMVVMPTDSVYGIGCAAKPGAPSHRRIYAAKKRPLDQRLPWLVSGTKELIRLGNKVPKQALDLAKRFWPGALTIVVPASPLVAPEYRSPDGSIAMRCPDSPLVRELAKRVGPLAVTSANLHGGQAAADGADIDPALIEAADLVIDSGPAPVGVASTIVSYMSGEARIVREGAISREQIEAALAQ